MNKKSILIFAHYYYPDIASTGQILKDQAEGMLEDFDVTVICVVPSYEGIVSPEYKTQKYYFEKINGVKIIRVQVPEFNKENSISRIFNILTYFFRSLKASKKTGKQDYIFTISQPPILGGLLGVFVKWRKQAKLIYCIQDFNPEQIMAIGYFNNKLILKIAMVIDKFSCKNSNLIITVGRDMVSNLKNRFKGKNVPKHIMINNWIDESKIYPLNPNDEKVIAFRKKYGLQNKFVIMYSGNIGLYYDLENIIKVIGKFKESQTADGKEVIFAFVGSGSMLSKLMEYKVKNSLNNVIFIPYQDKKDLIYSLNAGDVHWCVNSKGIKGVSCPSKVYGIMAVAKPILGVLEKDTEVRNLIEKCGCGKCCEPGEYDQIEELVKWYIENSTNLEMGMKGRIYLEKNLAKDISIKKYCEEIKNL